MPLMYDFHHIHSFPSFTEEGSAPQTGGNDSPKVTDIEEKETMTIKAEQTFPTSVHFLMQHSRTGHLGSDSSSTARNPVVRHPDLSEP